MKLLFTSVGRRVELIQAFRNGANKLNVNLQIYGADITDSAPALQFCDHKVIVPPIKSKDYVETLQRICRENEIDGLIPTIDTDLAVLSKNRMNFGDTKVIISDIDKICICRDKKKTDAYFRSLGLMSPKAVDDWKNYDLSYPAFIKPKDGSSSVLAYKINNREELKSFAEQIPEYIVQPFIDGTEYTVDMLCDFIGNPIFITPRIRLAVRAGEVLKTKIVQDQTIINEIRQLLQKYKPCGPITVQLIREKKSGIDYFIEINPRFGGGAPLSIKAGADSALALIKLLEGATLNYADSAAQNGLIFSRFDQSVCVNGEDFEHEDNK